MWPPGPRFWQNLYEVAIYFGTPMQTSLTAVTGWADIGRMHVGGMVHAATRKPVSMAITSQARFFPVE